MAFVTNSLLVDSLLALSTLLYALYWFSTSTFNYWKDRGVPYVKPVPLFGNIMDVMFGRKSFFDVFLDIYNKLKGERFVGYFEFNKPCIMLRDLKLIQHVLIKDFSHFQNRGIPVDAEGEPLTANLLNLEGQQWRNLRYKLTPTFTSGKLKGMFEQIYNCGEDFLKEIEKFSKKGEAVEVKAFTNLFTIDVISSVAFGLQFNPTSPEGILFREMVKKAFAPSKISMMRLMIRHLNFNLAKALGITHFPKDLSHFFLNLTKATVEYRKKNNVKRNDFLQLLMMLKEQEESGKDMNLKLEIKDEEDAVINQLDYAPEDNTEKKTKVFTDDCIAAQSFIFLAAGSDTTSISLGYILYEIAKNPEIQKRLQDEVDMVLTKYKQFNYQAVKEMIYLDQIIQETQRKYSVAGAIRRICNTPYKIPDSDVIIEKGITVTIPMMAIHMDPNYYPDPEVFNPDRFADNNHKSSGTGTYLAFGDGPRICIGMRFATIEIKVCLARLMSQYSVKLSNKTQQPLQMDPSGFLMQDKGGIWVTYHKRTAASL